MEEYIARREFPIWAESEPVKIYAIGKEKTSEKKEPELPIRFRLENFMNGFWKNNKLVVTAALGLSLWTLLTCGLTGIVVRITTTEEVTAAVTSELRAGFSKYLADMEYEQSAAAFLAGEASLQTAMDLEADSLAKLLYGYRNNSLRDRKTLLWCVLARVDSSAYPGSVEGVVDQPKQWMFYSAENPIREDDRQLALEQLKLWHEGKYPAGFSDDFVYAEWSSTDIALRNTWEKNSSTSWWRFPE